MSAGRPAKHERSDFGERLYKLRTSKGLSQQEVAKHLTVTQQAYAGWERTTTALRPEDISNLADLFEVTTDYLLGRE